MENEDKVIQENIPEENKQVSKKKRKKKNYIIEFIKRVVITGVIAYLLLTFVFGIAVVKGNYMFPALRDGDLLITYKLEPTVSSETVLYKTPDGNRVGRIVAMENDVVDISEDGALLINDVRISEEIFYPTTKISGSIKFPYTVPASSFFILNDYRTLEEPDSRIYSAINKNDIKGKVVFLFRRRGF